MLCAIPMEIANRELDGTIYLSLHLAKRGLSSLFGERMVHEYLFRLNKGMPVLYFDQDQSASVNREILDAGGCVFNLNAEGQNLDLYPQLVELFAKVAPTFTRMFVRGEEQKRHLVKAFPDDKKECVIVTGHPSFDLLHSAFVPFYENPDIVAQHGNDYILVNTQFVYFNHKMGFDNYLKMIKKMEEWKELYSDAGFMETVSKHRVFEGKVAEKFIEMVRTLAVRFPERHIILRPHPQEGFNFYTSRLGDLDNVFVKHDGPVRPWLASSGAVIHHSCTTGVEALTMGKLVVRYDPVPGGEVNMQSSAGMRAETLDQVVDQVSHGIMDESVREAQLEIMRPHMANSHGGGAARIAEVVAGFADESRTWLPAPLDFWESLKCWRKYVSKLIRARQPGHNGRKVRYSLDKFPRLPLSEVLWRVDKFREIEPDLPAVSVEQLGLNTFLIKPL